MKYNEVIETEIITDLTTEPVLLSELKRHLNMLFDTSGSYTFTDDDTYLDTLIPTARQALEQYTGLAFAEKTLKVVVRNECGDIELPGPVISITTFTDLDGNTYSAYTTNGTGRQYRLSGNQFKKLMSPLGCYFIIEYTAGYGTDKLPVPLKRAILEQCQFMYDNRGSQRQPHQNVIFDLCTSALELAAPYKRKSFLQ